MRYPGFIKCTIFGSTCSIKNGQKWSRSLIKKIVKIWNSHLPTPGSIDEMINCKNKMKNSETKFQNSKSIKRDTSPKLPSWGKNLKMKIIENSYKSQKPIKSISIKSKLSSENWKQSVIHKLKSWNSNSPKPHIPMAQIANFLARKNLTSKRWNGQVRLYISQG